MSIMSTTAAIDDSSRGSRDGSSPSLRDHMRASWEIEGRRGGDDNKLGFVACTSIIWAASGSFSFGAPEARLRLEPDLHDLWFAYYHASRNITSAHANQDRLVVQLLTAGAMGVLTRRRSRAADSGSTSSVDYDGEREEAVVGDNGARLWRDLPFLVEDMTAFWLQAEGTPAERQNFASFLARLVGVGVDDRLAGCALSILRDTLETDRPYLRPERANDSAAAAATTPTVLDLLPIAGPWLLHANNAIFRLSEAAFAIFPDELGRPGELARAAGVERDGFSAPRLLFWVDRLRQIGTDLPQAEADLVMMHLGNLLCAAPQFDFRVTHQLIRRGLVPSVADGDFG
jgi:Protein of unknown function (DUF3632)